LLKMTLSTPKFMAGQEGGEPLNKRQRPADSSSSSSNANAEINKLTQMVTNIAKLALETKTELREVTAALPTMQTILTPETFEPSIRAVEQGKAFAKLAEEKKGTKLESPHVKIGMAFFMQLSDCKELDKDFAQLLHRWWATNVEDKEEEQVEAAMPVFIAKKPQVPSKQWRKPEDANMGGEAAEDISYIKIKIALRDVNFLDALMLELVRLGSKQGVGVAPKSKWEREVAKAVRKSFK
jgi:hypothetical protein